ncbi:caspase family protein [Microcoleus sp. herbarium19]|uniref:caspase family protein n=1 Tax=unclassified Microcoleus TaxID=2642155 RepID=UPI002FD63355
MAKGISIHVGLNYIDKTIYGFDGALKGCINDAKALQAVAKSQGFESQLILDEEATYTNIHNAIVKASHELFSEDTFFLTIACHGAQIPSLIGSDDEVDGLDETWVLFDRQLIDDELYDLLGQFRAGVRIIVLSDSCHSGTMLRPLSSLLKSQGAQEILTTFTTEFISEKPRVFRRFELPQERNAQKTDEKVFFRAVPPEISRGEFKQHSSRYQQIQKSLSTRNLRENIQATVLLLSGCQDNQLSSDGEKNGLFTETLLKVWNSGSFQGNYISMYKQIRGNMPPWQTPNYYTVGADASEFEKQIPFSIVNPISINGDSMSVNPNPIPAKGVFEIASETRFWEGFAVSLAVKAAEIVAEELTRGGVVGNRAVSPTSANNTRFWESIVASVGTEVFKAVIEEVTRGGVMGNGTALSGANHDFRGWGLPKVNAFVDSPLLSIGVSTRELVLEQLAKEGVVRSNTTSSTSLDRSWDSLLEKVAEKVLEKVINKL